jgi:hypothetical protein
MKSDSSMVSVLLAAKPQLAGAQSARTRIFPKTNAPRWIAR